MKHYIRGTETDPHPYHCLTYTYFPCECSDRDEFPSDQGTKLDALVSKFLGTPVKGAMLSIQENPEYNGWHSATIAVPKDQARPAVHRYLKSAAAKYGTARWLETVSV